METSEQFIDSNLSDSSRQTLLSCNNKNDVDSLTKNCPIMTEREILQMFENNEDSLKYYLSLKEAVIANRKLCETCCCDPLDLKMKDRLDQSRWKPRVVLKMAADLANSECEDFEFSSKQLALDENGQNQDCERRDSGETAQETGIEIWGLDKGSNNDSFRCGLYGCNQRFTSLASYESHYHTCHNHVCATCKSCLVSEFLLDIHLQENHDAYFQILSPRINMFRCLVESCDLKFRTPELRKNHLVRIHKLPANFMFHKLVKTKPRKSKTSAKSASSMCTDDNNTGSPVNLSSASSLLLPQSLPSTSLEIEMEDQPSSGKVASTEKTGGRVAGRGKMVPRTVCFGRGSRRAFQNLRPSGRTRHWHQMDTADTDTTVDIEKVDFSDMIDSIEGT